MINVGLGIAAYTYDLGGVPKLASCAQLGIPEELSPHCVMTDIHLRGTSFGSLNARVKLADEAKVPDLRNNVFGAVAVDRTYERGMFLMAALHRPLGLECRERGHKVASLLERALRLRTALRSGDLDPLGDVVLSSDGQRVEHAAGSPAANKELLGRLRDEAMQADRARSRRHSDQDALKTLWRLWLAGEYSQIDRFDSDGKHHIVLHRNPLGFGKLRELTERERRVLKLALQADKQSAIAREVGLSEGRVSQLLATAGRKLGTGSRMRALSALGRMASIEADWSATSMKR